MSGPRSSESFNCCLRGIGSTGARLVLTLCALTLLLSGCTSTAARTSVLPPAPATPGAIITEAWSYDDAGKTTTLSGDWLHLPAAEAGELLLWIETAERM